MATASEEDVTTALDESTDQSSDKDSETSCIDSDLQELYESFDLQDDDAPAPESGHNHICSNTFLTINFAAEQLACVSIRNTT